MLDASAVRGIVSHMNEDHGDAVLLYAQVLAGMPEATGALLADLNSDAMRLDVHTPDGAHAITIPFDEPLTDKVHARQTLVALVREARRRLAEAG